jgi:pimeloyl-ACP methyl ester carboxylesterase
MLRALVRAGPSFGALLLAHEASGRLASHPRVDGPDVAHVEVTGPSYPKGKILDWSGLSRAAVREGLYTLRAWVPAGGLIDAVEVPTCAVRKRILLDGQAIAAVDRAPAIVHLLGKGGHEVAVEVKVSTYERRIACGAPMRVGQLVASREGWASFRYPSGERESGGGQAAMFVPPGHDCEKASVALVGLHPWNGDIWTYAAYEELAREATRRDVVLVLPPGLGNSLYVAKAEREVMRALDAAGNEVAINPIAVGLWGASMGGAGATTIGFHRPDRFSTVISFFGDSQYDMSSYVRRILKDEAGAKQVNALDVVENARNLPVWLIHGAADSVSSVKQSEVLHVALRQRGFDVAFDRLAGRGHEGALVAEHLGLLVERVAKARVPTVTRVTYRSFRADDEAVYDLHWQRSKRASEVFVDVARQGDALIVKRADGLTRLALAPGAFGAQAGQSLTVTRDPGVKAEASWQLGRAP